VERDHVRLAKERLERPIRLVVVRPAPRVEHPHVEAPRPLGDRAPDPTQTDDPERRPRDLVSLQRLVCPAAPPAARTDEPVAGDDPAPNGEEEAEREIRRRGSRDAGRVRDRDPTAAGRLDVDEVIARAVVRDDAKVGQQLQQRLADLLGNDGQRLDAGSRLLEPAVEVLDIAELVPGRAWEPSCRQDFQGWRRGLEPPTTGTTTRGSTN
jgi:hypothetical protein